VTAPSRHLDLSMLSGETVHAPIPRLDRRSNPKVIGLKPLGAGDLQVSHYVRNHAGRYVRPPGLTTGCTSGPDTAPARQAAPSNAVGGHEADCPTPSRSVLNGEES
jgi:hypothetical protein